MKNFPACYIARFYRNLVDNVDSFFGSDFYGRIENDYGILSDDLQKYILATSDFANAIQTDIIHYVTKDRINNVSFRKKLDPISKIIIRRQNALGLVFEDISTFDGKNSIVGSLLKELDVSKKEVPSDLLKKAPRPPGIDITLRNRLNKLKNRPEPKHDNNNLSPPPSPQPPSFCGTTSNCTTTIG